MAMYFFVPDEEKQLMDQPLNAERLLRSLGVTGKLVGFQYAVYMVEQVTEDPSRIQLITKRLYPETARRFGVSPMSVDRALRTLIKAVWKKADHDFLEHIAGAPLHSPPSGADFIDMLAGYLRRLQ